MNRGFKMNLSILVILALLCTTEKLLGSSQTNPQIPNLFNQNFNPAAGNVTNPANNNVANIIGQQLNSTQGGIEKLLGPAQTNSQIPNLVNQSFNAAAGNGAPPTNAITNTISQQLNGATKGQASGIIGQITSAINNQVAPSTGAPNSGASNNSNPANRISDKENNLESIEGALTGIDPTSIDAEKTIPNMDPNQGTAGGGSMPPPDLGLLWRCKRDSSMNKALCAVAIQNFCSGRCTRLNCMVPTNYVTCTDVCGEKATMMQPCMDAGKLNVGPAQIMNVQGAFDPSAPPPPPPDPAPDNNTAESGADQPDPNAIAAMIQQQQQMALLGLGVGVAGAGIGAAAKGIGAAGKGIGNLFKKKK